MIAFRKKRELSVEHKAAIAGALRSKPAACCASGAATSAAKMMGRVGVVGRNLGVWLWVPGEGWVAWRELHEQVTAAYEQWRIRKSLEGVIVKDGWEWRQAQINEAVTSRRANGAHQAWLRRWSARHAELVERAGLEEGAA